MPEHMNLGPAVELVEDNMDAALVAAMRSPGSTGNSGMGSAPRLPDRVTVTVSGKIMPKFGMPEALRVTSHPPSGLGFTTAASVW
jgi:hypothetical protein